MPKTNEGNEVKKFFDRSNPILWFIIAVATILLFIFGKLYLEPQQVRADVKANATTIETLSKKHDKDINDIEKCLETKAVETEVDIKFENIIQNQATQMRQTERILDYITTGVLKTTVQPTH